MHKRCAPGCIGRLLLLLSLRKGSRLAASERRRPSVVPFGGRQCMAEATGEMMRRAAQHLRAVDDGFGAILVILSCAAEMLPTAHGTS